MTLLEYVIPGQELPESERPVYFERPYWRILCPHCGEVHERLIQIAWEDLPETILSGNPEGDVKQTHYFICMETGYHFKIEQVNPFSIITKIQFRKPPSLRKALPGDDGTIPF